MLALRLARPRLSGTASDLSLILDAKIVEARRCGTDWTSLGKLGRAVGGNAVVVISKIGKLGTPAETVTGGFVECHECHNLYSAAMG
jgi:hypothetical protein